MKRWWVVLFFALWMGLVQGQERDWHEAYHDLIDELSDTADSDNEDMEELLATIAEQPINLNAATRSDLEQLLFLTNTQIDELLDYIAHYGPMLSKAELLMLRFLDPQRRELLAALSYLGPAAPREYTFLDSLKYDLSKNGHHSGYYRPNKGELTLYGKIPFYTRRGDDDGYHGPKYKHWVKFSYAWDHVRIGFTAAQDAGEPWFKGANNYGYDYYTAFVQLQNLGIIKNCVVGRYRIKAGMGLILNSNLYLGKTFGISSAQNATTIIRPHNSKSIGNYLQGGAITLAPVRDLNVTLFASYRKIDATLNDSTSIRTILTSGYHRTDSEIARKNNAAQTTAGLVVNYSFLNFTVGVNSVYNHYSLPLQPYTIGSSDSQLYRMFYPAGQDFWNVSINYGYKLGKRLRIEGETATGNGLHVATIDAITYRASQAVTINAIYRYYPIQFTTTLGKSFSEGGRNQNEHGIYLGITWTPSDRLSLTGYTDYAHFAWAKYLTLGASNSFDNSLQATYSLTPHATLTARYRVKLRQRNGDTAGELVYKTDQRIKVTYSLDLRRLTLKTQLVGSICSYQGTTAGGMVYQTARYKAKRWDIALGAGYFYTQDYNSRVYIYDTPLPHALGSTSFFGHGIHLAAMPSYTPCRQLTIIAKLTYNKYFNRDTIGSALQTISHSYQTDLELMLQVHL